MLFFEKTMVAPEKLETVQRDKKTGGPEGPPVFY
jgi:hypothetical protein